ncbi:MAG: GNAT family N-acetyltransferase [Alphaproteobacteria bacterium]|nr:GNAT family N-acetyltransferase [Alphaproteobacteria bacterium]
MPVGPRPCAFSSVRGGKKGRSFPLLCTIVIVIPFPLTFVVADSTMVTIRTAKTMDAAGIARVHVDTWRTTYAGMLPDRPLLDLSQQRQLRSWLALIRAEPGRQIVAIDGTAGVVAFGSCGRARRSQLPYDGEVFTLYVLPDYQGQGIGRRLLAGLFGVLAKEGFRSALVWVLAGNPARFFYRFMGGSWVAVREESLFGTRVEEHGYGWLDLGAVTAKSDPGSTI